MQWVLRRATARDRQRISELFVEMFRMIYCKQAVAGYADGDPVGYFAGGEDWICVAEADGRVVAFLAMEAYRGQRNYIYLDDFSVGREYRIIVLYVEKFNISARRLYERMGFEVLSDDGDRFRLIQHLQ